MLLVHSPAAEKKFVAEGYGINRRLVMHNDFIVVGPAEDPAKIKGMKATTEAFKKIASAGALFLSRGDNSGTHAKEKDIWKASGINPEGQKWYQQTGLGMGQTLNVASEKKGYTLADRGTYLAMKKNLQPGYSGGGRRHPSEHLPCHRSQPGQMAQSEHRPGQKPLPISWSRRKLRRSSRPSGWTSSALLSSSPMPAKRKRNWGK